VHDPENEELKAGKRRAMDAMKKTPKGVEMLNHMDMDKEKEHMAKVLSEVTNMAKQLADGETQAVAAAVVGRCRLTVSSPALKATMVSALETIIW